MMQEEKMTLEDYLFSQGNLDASDVSIVADEVRSLVAGEIADILTTIPKGIFTGNNYEDTWTRITVQILEKVAEEIRKYPEMES